MLLSEQITPAMCGRIRIVRGKLDQPTFAGLLNVSPSYISMIEKGKRLPGTSLTELISIKFNVNLDWLLTGEGEMYGSGGRAVPLPVETTAPLPQKNEGKYTAFEKEYIDKLLIILRYKDSGTRSAITQNIDTFLRVPTEQEHPEKKRKTGNDG